LAFPFKINFEHREASIEFVASIDQGNWMMAAEKIEPASHLLA
jgi:hypothetical protein